MVNRLLKYEAKYYLRSMTPIAIILIGMAVINRIIQLFESDSSTYDILFYSSAIALGIVCATCVIMSVVFVITRFYKNMFTDEGYLTLVLPVTEDQHIWGKLIAAMLNIIAAFLLVLVSLMIATSGDMLHEILKAVGYVGNYVREEVGTANFVFYIIEGVVMLIAATGAGCLLFYSCLALGQLAKKNRIASSFGWYFIYYIITQIIGTVIVIVLNSHPEIIEPLVDWAEENPESAIHFGILGMIFLSAVLGLVFYLITRGILKKKLNLE